MYARFNHAKWLPIGLLAIALVGIIFFGKPEYSFSWDSHNKMVQADSLWQNGYLSDELNYAFKEQDPNYQFFPHASNAYAKIQGRYVSAFPVALAALFAPILQIFGAQGLVIASALFLLPATYLLQRFWGFRGLWLLAPLLFTYLTSFSLEYSEHMIVAFLTLFGLSLFLKTDKPFAAGSIVGLAVFFRHEAMPLLLAIGLACLVSDWRESKGKAGFLTRHRSTIRFSLGASIVIFLFFGFNFLLYGHPLGPRFLINADGLAVPLSTRLDWAVDLLLWHEVKPGLFGYVPGMALILIVSVIRLRALDKAQRILLLTILFTIPLILAIAPNNGIMDWGPRYFGFLLLPALVLAHETWHKVNGRRLVRITLVVFGSVTILLNAVGITFLRESRKMFQEAHNTLLATESDIWIFSGIGPFYLSGTEYLRTPMIVFHTPEQMPEVLSILEKTNPGKTSVFVGFPRKSENTPEMAEQLTLHSFSDTQWKTVEAFLEDANRGEGKFMQYMSGTIPSSASSKMPTEPDDGYPN